jgi:glutamate 5-kinase
VVKVGSAVIAGKGRLRPRILSILARDVTALQDRGCEVVMVVSGAVAAGYRPLGMHRMPTAVVERQSAASVGQHLLMATISTLFEKHGVHVAQLLMSAEDIDNRRRFLSARHTLQMLLSRGIVPVINENDALSDDEAKVGDNDHLAAMVTSVVSADLLIILSTVHGVYRNGNGPVIPRVEVGSSLEQHISSSVSRSGIGGMAAKVSAARLVSRWAIPTVIADGTASGMLPRVLSGERVGTIFLPRERKLTARKRWIAVRATSRGVIRVDDGARDAILKKGASLLPSGIIDVDGRFPIGSRVDLQDEAGSVFAVGLVSYASEDVQRLRGRRVAEIEDVLGYVYMDEMIHRDDLVILD